MQTRSIKSRFRWATRGVLLMSAALGVYMIWELITPYNPLTMKPGSFIVQNPDKRVARGEPLLIRAVYCATGQSSPRMTLALELDGHFIHFAPQYPAATTGCHDVITPIVTIPSTIPIEATTAKSAGRARLHVTLHYRVNAIRERGYEFVTDEFVINP